jgi:toxin ParE1/3/4
VGEHAWSVRLSAAAETDYRQILRWTTQNFVSAQARTYADKLSLALQALIADPDAIGVRERPETGIGIRSLHVARYGRKWQHFLMFRIASNQNSTVIDVLRLLHDSMDLERYGPFAESD